MKRCIIIGGGLSGLSSAVYCSNQNLKVELIESSPKLGGRTFSFYDPQTNTEIDNGQHILMGAYQNTIEYLKIIGAEKIPEYQPYLKIDFIDSSGDYYSLNAKNKFYPINLFRALLNFNTLSSIEKINVLKFILKIKYTNSSINTGNLKNWLASNNQSENVIDKLWKVISVSALNTSIEETDPNMFKNIINQIFFTGNKSSTIILPNLPLSQLFVLPTQHYFEKNGIKVSTSERLIGLQIEADNVKNIITNKRKIEDFDKIILAIPNHLLSRIEGLEKILNKSIEQMETSPIITIHIWEKNKLFKHKFLGLLNFDADWIFNNGTHLSVVISAAEKFICMQPTEIFKYIINQLAISVPEISEKNVKHYKVLKSRYATLKTSIKNENKMKSQILKTKINNLIFSGDWTNTNLPNTIESAILSGKIASKQIIKTIK